MTEAQQSQVWGAGGSRGAPGVVPGGSLLSGDRIVSFLVFLGGQNPVGLSESVASGHSRGTTGFMEGSFFHGGHRPCSRSSLQVDSGSHDD